MVDEGLLAGGKHRAHMLRRESRRALWDQQPIYLEWTPEFKEGDRECDAGHLASGCENTQKPG